MNPKPALHLHLIKTLTCQSLHSANHVCSLKVKLLTPVELPLNDDLSNDSANRTQGFFPILAQSALHFIIYFVNILTKSCPCLTTVHFLSNVTTTKPESTFSENPWCLCWRAILSPPGPRSLLLDLLQLLVMFVTGLLHHFLVLWATSESVIHLSNAMCATRLLEVNQISTITGTNTTLIFTLMLCTTLLLNIDLHLLPGVNSVILNLETKSF